jgi:hypothetical protein
MPIQAVFSAIAATSGSPSVRVDPRRSTIRSGPLRPPHTPNSLSDLRASSRQSVRTLHRAQIPLALRSDRARWLKKISGFCCRQRAWSIHDMAAILGCR